MRIKFRSVKNRSGLYENTGFPLGASKESTMQVQQTVHTGEVFGLWQHLVKDMTSGN